MNSSEPGQLTENFIWNPFPCYRAHLGMLLKADAERKAEWAEIFEKKKVAT